MTPMRLADLLTVYPPTRVSGEIGPMTIGGLSADSRMIQPGDLFVAISGTAANGEQYAKNAIANGAVAVVCAEGALPDLPAQVFRIEVANPRIAAARYAAAFYQPQPQYAVAVTGTDGKSSTVEFLRQLLQAAGVPAASLGTIGMTSTVPLPGGYDAINTTPDPIVLHQLLQRLAQAGVQHVALEASSHGLDQFRLEGMLPEVGVFTTFGQDHLDYHASLEEYFNAKARLFRELLPPGATAVLNADQARILGLRAECHGRGLDVRTFGKGGEDCRLIEAVPVAAGQEVHVMIGGREWRGVIPLYGRFQVMNILAASGAALGLGVKPEAIVEAYPTLTGVRGRLELAARHAQGMPIFVDYAHTAQGLEQALSALRAHAQGQLHVVFGCGGNRDAGKRPEMGAVAVKMADRVIVTDDNPRKEDPALIRQAVMSAAQGAVEIGDRRKAIRTAVAAMQPGDVLLVAGKGHETYQIIGEEKLPFNDVEEAQAAVEGITA